MLHLVCPGHSHSKPGGHIHSFAFKESQLQAEEWKCHSPSSHWTKSWSQLSFNRSGCGASGLLSFVSCSKEHRAWEPAQNETIWGWLSSWMTLAAGLRYPSHRKFLLNSQQNTVCSAKQLIVIIAELYIVVWREVKLHDKVNDVQHVS